MGMTGMWMRSSIPTAPFQYSRYEDVKDVDETFYPDYTTPVYQVWGDKDVDEKFYPYSADLVYTRYSYGDDYDVDEKFCPTPPLQSTRYGDDKDVDGKSIPIPPLQSTRYGDDNDVDEKFCHYSTTPIYQVWV
jgi:hypothetical protein